MNDAVLGYEPVNERRVWLGRGTWALLDQAFFSASNWLLQIFLARYLAGGEPAYGAFSKAFTYFLFIGTFHTSLLVEPMLVFGPSRFAGNFGRYLGALSLGNFVLGGVGALLLALIGQVHQYLGQHDIAVACWSLAAASPFIFFLWLIRRACYVRLQPKVAAIAGVFYMALMVGGLGFLLAKHDVSVQWAMLVMAISCVVAGLGIARTEGVEKPGAAILHDAIDEHTRYGRWAAASGVVMFLPSQLYYFLVDQQTAGELRAMGNLFLPIIMANAALVGLLLPGLGSTRGTPGFKRMYHLALLILGGGPVVLWLLCGALHNPLMHLVYNGRYDDSAWLLWVLGLSPIASGLTNVYNAVLNTHGRPDRVFFASLAATVFACTGGVVLTWKFGLAGVSWSIVISTLISTIFAWHYTRKLPPAAPPTPAVPLAPEVA